MTRMTMKEALVKARELFGDGAMVREAKGFYRKLRVRQCDVGLMDFEHLTQYAAPMIVLGTGPSWVKAFEDAEANRDKSIDEAPAATAASARHTS